MKLLATAAALAVGGVSAWVAVDASGEKAPGGAAVAPVADVVAARPRPPAPTAVRLDVVVDVPGLAPGPATLALRVGEAVTTRAVTLPAFPVLLDGAAPADMVSIEVSRADAKYVAILGTARRIARKSRGDGVLTVDDLDRIRVTTQGTALAFYVRDVLGGRWPATDAEHEDAVRSVGNEAGIANHALRAIATGATTLPAGVPHAWALLGDRPGYVAFLAARPQLSSGWVASAALPTGIAFPQSSMAPHTAVLPRAPVGDAQYLSQGAAMLYRAGDGGVLFANGGDATDLRATLAQDGDDALLLTPADTRPLLFYPFLPVGPGGSMVQVRAFQHTLSHAYRRIFVGDAVELWSIVSRTRTVYPDHPDVAPAEATTPNVMHAIRLDDRRDRLTAADFRDGRALPYFCIEPDASGRRLLRDCEYAQVHLFPNGTGLALDLGSKVDAQMAPVAGAGAGQSLHWRQGPRGTMYVGQGTTVAQYWRIPGGDGRHDGLVYVARASEGGVSHGIAGQTVMVEVPAGGPADVADMQGEWTYATFEQQRAQNALTGQASPVRFFHDAGGVTRQVTYAGSSVVTARSGWRMVDNPVNAQAAHRLYNASFVGNTTQTYASCKEVLAAGHPQCTVRRVRYFRPIAVAGDRVTGIEEVYDNTAAAGQPVQVVRYSRPSVYTRIPVPQAAPPATAQARPRGR